MVFSWSGGLRAAATGFRLQASGATTASPAGPGACTATATTNGHGVRRPIRLAQGRQCRRQQQQRTAGRFDRLTEIKPAVAQQKQRPPPVVAACSAEVAAVPVACSPPPTVLLSMIFRLTRYGASVEYTVMWVPTRHFSFCGTRETFHEVITCHLAAHRYTEVSSRAIISAVRSAASILKSFAARGLA